MRCTRYSEEWAHADDTISDRQLANPFDVFGGDHSANSRALFAALSQELSSTIGVMASFEGIAAAVGRVGLPSDEDSVLRAAGPRGNFRIFTVQWWHGS